MLVSILDVLPSLTPMSTLCDRCVLSTSKWSHHFDAVNFYLRARLHVSSSLCRCIAWLNRITFSIVEPNAGREEIRPTYPEASGEL